jgi:hypothetical protein
VLVRVHTVDSTTHNNRELKLERQVEFEHFDSVLRIFGPR